MKTLSHLIFAFLLLSQWGMGPGPGTPAASGGAPAPPTGMLIWYRGDSLTCTLGCSGSDIVTAFIDKSGNGNNATGSTAAVYVGSVIGGQPGVLFSNSSSSVFTFGTALNLTSTTLTMCAAQKLTATSGKSSLVSGSGGSFTYWFDNSGSEQGADKTSSAQLINGTATPDTSFHSSCVTYDGTTVKLYLDGSTDGSNNFTNTITATETDVGANGGSEFYNGTLLDLVVYSSVLPATGANSVATWFTYTSARY